MDFDSLAGGAVPRSALESRVRIRRTFGLLITALLVAACTPTLVNFAPRVHVVQSGETLFSIAWRYQLDVRELVLWNELDNPDLILVGQRLFLTPGGMAETMAAGAGPASAAPSASPGQSGTSRSPGATPPGAPEESDRGASPSADSGQQASTSPAIPRPAPPVATPIPAPSSPPAPAGMAAGSMGAAPAGSEQAAAPQPEQAAVSRPEQAPAPHPEQAAVARPQPEPPPPQPSLAVLPSPTWQWPIRGPVVSPYGAAQGTGSGIGIGGQLGADIRASAAGQVVYAGDGLAAYGNLIIIKHNDTFLSAYGLNDELVVGEGDSVAQGDLIARMGMGPERQPQVHFEIRRNGTPVDPLGHLPN